MFNQNYINAEGINGMNETYNFKDLTGKRFGLLVAIEREESRGNGYNKFVYWKCKCDCGVTKSIRGAHLRNGATQSCGRHSSLGLDFGEACLNELIRRYKHNAKKRGHEYCLTKEQFISITKENCYYCGVEPKQKETGSKYRGFYIYNGIDRLNNEPFYKIENSIPCCKICNFMKSKLQKEEFLNHIKKIYERHKSGTPRMDGK
jgi:hypothetical protein